jgi:hypothetical protein
MGNRIGFEKTGARLVPLVGLDGGKFSDKGSWSDSGSFSGFILDSDGNEAAYKQLSFEPPLSGNIFYEAIH